MELPKKYDAHEAEARWVNDWEKQQVYAWDPEKGRDETFSVDTPPPTVSGSLHVGHLFSYSHQDFIVRYQRMRGKNIFFPIGWDDNGLPTERRVQNLYNVKCDAKLHYDPNLDVKQGSKGHPIPISRPNFIELCDRVTKEDEGAFKRLWSRLGLSYDWKQEYATIDEHCRFISQYSFLDLVEKGEAYQAERPVMWDVDYQTAIAQAEVEDRERQGQFHFLNFAVQGLPESDTITIATTRPELLAACVAVVAHPDDARYQHLMGKFAVTPFFAVPVPIVPDERADPEKGTGIVMVCTFGDQTDVEWWRQFDLPLRQIVGLDGRLLPVTFLAAQATSADGVPSLDPARANATYQQIQGKYVKEAGRMLMELAAQDGGIIARPSQDITQAVKYYEKGERPLELIPTRQWYVKIMDKKAQLLEQGRKIAWYPDYMLKRYEHWVDGLAQDWCVSRQRYFGVPIPVWYKIDTNGTVRYDQRLLPRPDQLPVDPFDDVPEGYSEAQRDRPGGFTGDPDVFDTWATSSLSPQVATRWIRDPQRHAKLFPMDIRPQAHDIIRTWAFYTIVKAYLHEGEVPWKNIVLSGWILDPDRKKMSKSKGNVVTPEPLVDANSADSLRYWAARARLGVDTAYDEQVFKVGKRLVTKVFNASKFAIERFSGVPKDMLTPDRITAEADRAVIAALRPLLERATKALDGFDYAQALSLIEEFFWGTFCDNFVELVKPRTYEEGLTEGRVSAAASLRLVHRVILRLLAPFVPFITEEVWSWTYADDEDMRRSIHRSPWPSLAEIAAVPPPQFEQLLECAVAVINGIRKAKADANASMAAPVERAEITADDRTLSGLAPALDDIKRMLRVAALDIVEGTPAEGRIAVRATLAAE